MRHLSLGLYYNVIASHPLDFLVQKTVLHFLKNIYVYSPFCVCVPHVCGMCVWVPVKPEDVFSSSRGVDTGSFEPPHMGAGIQTQIPWKSNMQP